MEATSPIYLVTGGSGFLGHHLIELLHRLHFRIRVLNRTVDRHLAALGVENVAGSVTDYQCVRMASRGVCGIFHLAGIVEHSRIHAKRLHDINVVGTENVMRAAAYEGVRVVFISTSGTVAVSAVPHVFDESAPYAESTIQHWPYYMSKLEAEKKAKAFAAETGTELVIIRPAAILGPGDPRLRAVSKVWKFLKRKHPYTPEGGIEIVDVRDVALACWQAMKKHANGKAYLLGAGHMSIADFFQKMEDISGVKKPMLRLPYPVVWHAMKATKVVATNVFNNHDTLDPVVVEMANHWWSVDAAAAKRDLLFDPRNVDETLKDTIEWLLQNGDAVEEELKLEEQKKMQRSKL